MMRVVIGVHESVRRDMELQPCSGFQGLLFCAADGGVNHASHMWIFLISEQKESRRKALYILCWWIPAHKKSWKRQGKVLRWVFFSNCASRFGLWRGEKVQVEIRLFGCLQAEVLVITHRFSAIYIWVITHFNAWYMGNWDDNPTCRAYFTKFIQWFWGPPSFVAKKNLSGVPARIIM